MSQDGGVLKEMDLRDNLEKLKKFNAKRKFRQAVLAHIAMEKMTHFIGMGRDLTFGFNKKSNPVPGVDAQKPNKRSVAAILKSEKFRSGLGCCGKRSVSL